MRVFPIAFAIFVLVPIIEIFLFIEIGGRIGALNTVLLVLATAAIGAALLRKQGLSALQKVQQELQRGELPAISMLDAMLLFFAGALLLTPGFFTDTIGLLLMIPPLRKRIALWLLERSGLFVQMHTHSSHSHSQHDDAHTLEGEYRRRDD